MNPARAKDIGLFRAALGSWQRETSLLLSPHPGIQCPITLPEVIAVTSLPCYPAVGDPKPARCSLPLVPYVHEMVDETSTFRVWPFVARPTALVPTAARTP